MADKKFKNDESGTNQTDAVAIDDAREEQFLDIDEAYLSAPWFQQLYRGVLLQMVLFGA
jgi:hypothetical protein